MDIRNILVPLDFSASSDQAFDYASFLADKFAAKLTLLNTILSSEVGSNDEIDLLDYERIVKKIRKNKQALLQEYVDKAMVKEIPVETVVTQGFSAGDSILDFVKTGNFELVVMGSRSGSSLIKWSLGSVAEKVIHASSIPVFTLHEPIEKLDIGKILIPVDFSTVARDASNLALFLSKIFKSRIEYLHVVDNSTTLVHTGGVKLKASDQAVTDLQDRITEHLGLHLDGDADKNIFFKVMNGKISEKIVEYADKNKYDLIVMSTGEKSGFDYLQVGSHTNGVIRRAPCPVLTVNKT